MFRARAAALGERLRAREDENGCLAAELALARGEAVRLATLNAQYSTQLDAERAAHERLTNEFKALSADALRSNRIDFLEQAKQAFAQLQQQSAGDRAAQTGRRSARETDPRIAGQGRSQDSGEIEKARAGAYGALGEQLKSLQVSQLQLQSEAARLSTALRSTQTAGSWGELQLRRVVEMADMLSDRDFTEQEASGNLRADLVVRWPRRSADCGRRQGAA